MCVLFKKMRKKCEKNLFLILFTLYLLISCYVNYIRGCEVMMVGWIAFLFGLACFLVCFFSLNRFGPADEGEGEKKIRSSQGFKQAGEGEFWNVKKRVRQL